MKKYTLILWVITLAVILIGCGIDIKPGSCPNPFNLNSKGVVPVAIHGTITRDVHNYDPDTVNLGDLYVIEGRSSYEDVSSPSPDGEVEPCPGGPDGYIDLVVFFDAEELAGLFNSVGAEDGEEWLVAVSGYNTQTEEMEELGIDTIVVRKKGQD